jgi:hypothetical protein
MSDYREEMHIGYWEGFIRFMQEHYPEYRFGKPSKESYQILPPSLNAGVQIAAGRNLKPEESIRVDVTLTNTPEEWFRQLKAQRRAIEVEVGISDGHWEWEERPGKAERHIILRTPFRLDGARREQYEWLAEGVDKFSKVFGPRLSSLEVTARTA